MLDINWEMGTGSARTTSFLEAVDDLLLTQMVDFSTQVKGNCLDLDLTNIPERIVDVCEAGRLGKSDHEMILITVNMQGGCEATSAELGTSRLVQYESGPDRHGLVTSPPEQNWKWEAFSSRLAKLVKKFVPVRTVRSRQRPIWMTSEILQAIKRKRRLWKDAKKGKNQEQYAEAENRVRKLRHAKGNFEKRLSNGNGGNNQALLLLHQAKNQEPPYHWSTQE